ncbi:MAG: hypothetical protein ABSA90_07280 [Xanthobacteraceae bacterium]|jgi:hypothetical protein
MPVRVERHDRVLTVIHSRAEARNAVDPEHAHALYEAFVASTPTRPPTSPCSGVKAARSAPGRI